MTPHARPFPALLRWGAPAAAGLVALALSCALMWPMPLDPTHLRVDGFFHDGHVWCFAHMADMLLGDAGWRSNQIGFPHVGGVELRFIGWGIAALVAPLQSWLGAVGAYNVALLASFPLGTVTGSLLFRRMGAHPAAAAAGALVLTVSPFALGSLAAGQVAKLQVWTLALGLLAVVACARRWRWVPLVAVATALIALTSPGFAMMWPLVGVAFGVWAGVREKKRWWALTRVAIGLALSAGVLWWARSHFDFEPGRGRLYAFAPSTTPVRSHRELLLTVAKLDSVLWGNELDFGRGGSRSPQIAYLGLPPLIVGALFSMWRAPGRLLGVVTLLGGAVLALGPRLADSAGFMQVGSGQLLMPAHLLELVGHPMARSAMYYRFLAVAALGAGCIVALGSGKRWWLAWAAAAWILWDGLSATAPLWPRPVAPVMGADALAEMAADPAPGAVVVMPLRVDDRAGGGHVMQATLHGRATSGLPRDLQRQPPTLTILGWLDDAASAPDPSASLAQHGVRYVMWLPQFRARQAEPDLAAMTSLLGRPQRDGDVRYWRVE